MRQSRACEAFRHPQEPAVTGSPQARASSWCTSLQGWESSAGARDTWLLPKAKSLEPAARRTMFLCSWWGASETKFPLGEGEEGASNTFAQHREMEKPQHTQTVSTSVPLPWDSWGGHARELPARLWGWAGHGCQSQVGRVAPPQAALAGASFLRRRKLAHRAGSSNGTASSGRGRGQEFVFNLLLVYLSWEEGE